jgi:hypothetical protein
VERLASILTVDNAYIAEVEYDGGETLELACDADTDLLLRVVTTALGVYRIRASHPYGSDYDVDQSSNFAVPVTPVVTTTVSSEFHDGWAFDAYAQAYESAGYSNVRVDIVSPATWAVVCLPLGG